MRRRVFTYITFKDQLLVLDHVNQPDLHMQIPGGTIEVGELPADAAIREAEEETGLSGFTVKSFLGDFEQDLSSLGRAEIIHAYFYHLEISEVPPMCWQHSECDPHGQVEPILFELYWVKLVPSPNFGGIDGAKYVALLESYNDKVNKNA